MREDMTPLALKKHVYTHSLGERFSCPDCEERFPFKSILAIHRLRREEEQKYVCKVKGCTKKFKHKGELVWHKKEHEGVTWICNVCQYETNTQRKLDAHMGVHTQYAPEEKF